jgi:signal transduction histidine kinase
MLEETVGKDNPEIKIIIRNAKRLQRLTENILSVTRLESKTLTLQKESFDFNEVVSACIRDESIQMENKNIKILYNTDYKKTPIEADKDRISQVVSNLLHNAIKFTNDGKIIVTLKHRDADILVSVKDNGRGIDSQILSILFSKFVTKSDRGTGLGLYICKGIVEAHGGEIWAENNNDIEKGATFFFTLPV